MPHNFCADHGRIIVERKMYRNMKTILAPIIKGNKPTNLKALLIDWQTILFSVSDVTLPYWCFLWFSYCINQFRINQTWNIIKIRFDLCFTYFYSFEIFHNWKYFILKCNYLLPSRKSFTLRFKDILPFKYIFVLWEKIIPYYLGRRNNKENSFLSRKHDK